MIESVLVLTTALLFFFIGRWSRSYKRPQNDTIDEIVESARKVNIKQIRKEIVEQNKKVAHKLTVPPGPIHFKTPEEREYEVSDDKKLADHWEKSGIADVIRENK